MDFSLASLVSAARYYRDGNMHGRTVPVILASFLVSRSTGTDMASKKYRNVGPVFVVTDHNKLTHWVVDRLLQDN
jgi:hypothetical protein